MCLLWSDLKTHWGCIGCILTLIKRRWKKHFVFYPSGLASGGNLSGLELSSMMGGMKDTGGQSRFKWMMEGHSPAPSPPNANLHKNGRCNRWVETQFLQLHHSHLSWNTFQAVKNLVLRVLTNSIFHSVSENLLIRDPKGIHINLSDLILFWMFFPRPFTQCYKDERRFSFLPVWNAGQW